MITEDNIGHVKIKLEFIKGLYDESIDATYILYLEGNLDRYNQIIKQIEKNHPTKNIYFIMNKGYKKCKKNVNVTNPTHDCTYSHLEAYIHAENNNFNNVLILEDDFIFDEDISNRTNIIQINNFLNEIKDQQFIYFFGGCPVIVHQIPDNLYHYHCTNIYAFHGYIPSKKFRQKILSLNKQEFVNDLNFEANLNKNAKKYMFYKPLIYQLFPVTDNQKIWGTIFGLKSKLYLFLINLVNLDKEYKKPYAIMYYVTKNLKIIIILIFFIIYLTFIFL